MANFCLPSALKAQQWERAKGELRALVALQGSYNTSDEPPGVVHPETTRWYALQTHVEQFIKSIEYDALQE